MRHWIPGIVALALLPVPGRAAWTFQEINYSPGSSIGNAGIAWRPQGDYALLAYSGSPDGLIRYDHPAGPLTAQGHHGADLERIEWAADGSYALVTGGGHIYRYDHAATGFGALTEIASIETAGISALTFYDVLQDPAHPGDPLYVLTNAESASGQHQIVVYRYEPGGSPYELFRDFSGGTTYASQWAYGPVSGAFHPLGDYLVIANKLANGYSQGIFLFDPDQSTFPKEPSGAMQFHSRTGQVGNACAVTMSRAPGRSVILLKGNGDVQRATQTGVPPSLTWDEPGGPSMTDYEGDAAYSSGGARAVVVERQTWSPHHRIGTFDADGNAAGGIDLLGIPERSIRIRAVAWHPAEPCGLLAGQDGWIISFETDEAGPTPSPSPTGSPAPTATLGPSPTPTRTPTVGPTLTPTVSATPTRTATAPPASPTPGTRAYLELHMPDRHLRAGETFHLERRCGNLTLEPLMVDEYVALEVLGYYWFWPHWTPEVDWVGWVIPAGGVDQDVLLLFTWPPDAGVLEGARFWGALLSAGSLDVLAWDVVEWGFS